ncbi:MAG: DUF7453 family protein [Nitrospirales bacterium]
MKTFMRCHIIVLMLFTGVTAVSAEQTFTYTKIADTTTHVPMGDGTFQEFVDSVSELTLPAIDHGNIVFWGRSGSRLGLYQFTETQGIQLIADTNTLIPGSTETFQWTAAMSLHQGEVAFWGTADPNSEGIYLWHNGTLESVADWNTVIPDSSETFQSLGYPSLGNGKIVFVGTDANDHHGIYQYENGALQTLIDENTPAPATLGSFDFFAGASLDDGLLGFGAGGTSSHSGIFTLLDGTISTLADTTTPIPGETAPFSAFEGIFDCARLGSCVYSGPYPVFSAGKSAFVHIESTYGPTSIYSNINGLSLIANAESSFPGTDVESLSVISPSIDQNTIAFMAFNHLHGGLYISKDGNLTKVIDTNDMLDEKAISLLLMGPYGLSGNQLVFLAIFDDGTSGIYRADFSSENRFTSIQDSFIRNTSANSNEGNNPTLRIQKQGKKRTVVEFHLPQASSANFSRATLTLTMAEPTKNMSTQGRFVNVHRLMESFVEGNGKRLGIPKSERTSGIGEGVTWHCATDSAIHNSNTDCAVQWVGGDVVAGPASDSVLQTTGMTGEVSWDVTTDVRDALNEKSNRISWLLKLANENQGGKAVYHSKEGAVTLGDPSKGPTLFLEY